MALELHKWYKFSTQNADQLTFRKKGDAEYSVELLLKYQVAQPDGVSGFEHSLGHIIRNADNKYSVILDKERDYMTHDPSKRVKITFQEFFLFKL